MFQNDEIIDEKYKILKSLGVGERAKIFLVLNMKTKKKNVLKVFSDVNNQDNIQHVNLTKMINLDEIVAIKDQDLKDMKEENDLSDQGITVQPKPFKSVTAENNALRAIRTDLDDVIKTLESNNYDFIFFENSFV